MRTSLDCIPCILCQTLNAARLISKDPTVHENIMRDVLGRAGEMDLEVNRLLQWHSVSIVGCGR